MTLGVVGSDDIIDSRPYFPLEIISELMDSVSEDAEDKSWEVYSSVGTHLHQFSPLKTVLRFHSCNTGSRATTSTSTSRKLNPPYKLIDSHTLNIEGEGTFAVDSVSLCEESSNLMFFDQYVEESVDDAILGQERTIVSLGSSGQEASHPFFTQDNGAIALALNKINQGQADDIWKLLTAISGATMGVSCVEVTKSSVYDLLWPSASSSGLSSSFKITKSTEIKVDNGIISGAQVVNSSDPAFLLRQIMLAHDRNRARNFGSTRSRASHMVTQIYVRPTGGRLTFIDLCQPEDSEELKQGTVLSHIDSTVGWPVLKQAVEGLAAAKPNVPFPDVKMNRLMCEILTEGSRIGNSRTVMILCADSSPALVRQAVKTLALATRARDLLSKCFEARLAQRIHERNERNILRKQIEAKDELIRGLHARNCEISALLVGQKQPGNFPFNFSSAEQPEFNSCSSWPVPETSRKPPFESASERSKSHNPFSTRARLAGYEKSTLSSDGDSVSCESFSGDQAEIGASNRVQNGDYFGSELPMSFVFTPDDSQWPEAMDSDCDSEKQSQMLLEGKESDCLIEPLAPKADELGQFSSCSQCSKERRGRACPHSGQMPAGVMCCFSGMFKKNPVHCT